MKNLIRWSLVPVVVATGFAAEPAAEEEGLISLDEAYEVGRNLFDTYAPDEIKEQYEFPDKARWDRVVKGLQAALAGNDPKALLPFESDVREAVAALRRFPGGGDYADWLAERLDYIEAAKQMPRTPPTPPKPPVVKPKVQTIPNYDLWVRRIKQRAQPANAPGLVRRLKPVFTAKGTPGDLVWLAEVESSFNPTAKSPVGARGLFQLMPATAKELGLSTMLPDERTHPEKSAAAAATYLKQLHKRFGDWPLAIAAYNAGGGRVSRALQKQKAKTFAEIAPILSVETQMYVPKVLATLQVRAGTTITGPGPR
jgi:membrane-bound lytic murein transglycosylase D